MQLNITFYNSNRTNQNIEVEDFYIQNKYYYAPFYIPKIKYDEKFCKVLICLKIDLKQELSNDETFKFDLELIDSEEISNEFNLNVTSNKNNLIVSPKFIILILKKIFTIMIEIYYYYIMI